MNRSALLSLAASVVVGGLSMSAFGGAYSEDFSGYTVGTTYGDKAVIRDGEIAAWGGDPAKVQWTVTNDGDAHGNYLKATGADQHLIFGNTTDMGGSWQVSFDFYRAAGASNQWMVGTPANSDGSWQLRNEGPTIWRDGWNSIGSETVTGWNSYKLQKFTDGSFILDNLTTGKEWSGTITTPDGFLQLTWQTGMAIDNINVSAVPEPASLGLLGLGALFMGRRRRA